jgi:hypothetical protein
MKTIKAKDSGLNLKRFCLVFDVIPCIPFIPVKSPLTLKPISTGMKGIKGMKTIKAKDSGLNLKRFCLVFDVIP